MTTPAPPGNPSLLQVSSQPVQVSSGQQGLTVLLVNTDLLATMFAGYTNDIAPNGTNTLSIPPLGSATMDGSRTIYVCSTANAYLQIVPGGGQWVASPAQIAEQIALVGINVNVTGNNVLSPSGDMSGVTDITNITNLYSFTSNVTLAVGQFYITTPILPKAGQTLAGSHGATASGDDAANFYGTVINVVAGFTNPVFSAYATAAVLLMDTTPGTGGNSNGIRLKDFWVNGTAGPALVDGVCGYGPVNAVQCERVGVYNMTGNGFHMENDAGGGTQIDGWHMYSCLAQNCTGFGFGVRFADDCLIDCHAQGCGADGFSILSGGNCWFIGCRSDLNLNGFTCDAPNGGSGDQFYDSIKFIGCGTQGNTQNGLNVINSSAAGTSARVTVIVDGCNYDGDGTNAGAGGGSYAGISITGRNLVLISNTNVSVMNAFGPSCPEYGLSVQPQGTAPGHAAFIYDSGCLNGETAPTNLGITNAFLISASVMVATGLAIGYQNYTLYSEPFTSFNPLSNSWAVAPSYTNAGVRLAPGMPDCIQIDALMTPGGGANNNDGTIVATLGTRFRPSQTKTIPATTDVIGAGSPRFSLDSTGALKCYSIAATSTQIGIQAIVNLNSE